MHSFSIPTCYFPSTALFIDDNRDFLLNFVLQLDEGLAYRIFDNPHRALHYIHNKHCELDLLSQHCLKADGVTKESHSVRSNHMDLSAIHAEVYNPHRFSEISVVVVDYAMPGINGLEFCRQIENSNIKKILLTGQADEKLAIQAFNEGVIHRYIKKSDADAAEQIINSIYTLQRQYFQAMSDLIARMLSIQFPSCLHDRKFAQFLQQLRMEKQISEYYLADEKGSFFMLNDDALPSFLLIRSEEDVKQLTKKASFLDLDPIIYQQLAEGKLLPYEPEPGGGKEQTMQFFPATRIEGNQTYYYAHIEHYDKHLERPQKILSYNRYLEELDAEELLMD